MIEREQEKLGPCVLLALGDDCQEKGPCVPSRCVTIASLTRQAVDGIGIAFTSPAMQGSAMQRLGSAVGLLAIVFLSTSAGHEVGAAPQSMNSASSVPSAPIVQGTLIGISAVDAFHAWAVGNFFNGIGIQPTLLATADGGATWTRQQAPHAGGLNGVSFVNQSTGWIIGNTCAPQGLCPEVTVTHDGGMTWV